MTIVFVVLVASAFIDDTLTMFVFVVVPSSCDVFIVVSVVCSPVELVDVCVVVVVSPSVLVTMGVVVASGVRVSIKLEYAFVAIVSSALLE